MPQLKRKLESLPSINQWKIDEAVQNHVTIEGLTLSFCGIQATHPTFGAIVGSATEVFGDPWDRAWYELVERISIVEAIKATPSQFITRDITGKSIGMLPFQQVFPSPPPGEEKTWQPAKSNGIAIEQSWEKAATKAVWELAERHLILETWLGIRQPQAIDSPSIKHVHALKNIFDVQCISFGSVHANASEIHSCGVFLFPKSEQVPLIFGFGAAPEQAWALAKAEAEALQRLSFLWGETIPTELPELAPNALYHQEYFLVPAMLPLVKKWLNGKFLNSNTKKPEEVLSVQFVDLSSYAPNGLYLARAIAHNSLPVMFGRYREKEFKTLEEERVIHPIA